MERRHLFECEMQHKVLEKFDDLARIKDLANWKAFAPQLTEIFGTSGTRRRFESAGLVCAGDVSINPAKGDEFFERPQLAVHAAGPAHIQSVCRTKKRRSGAGPEEFLEISGALPEAWHVLPEKSVRNIPITAGRKSATGLTMVTIGGDGEGSHLDRIAEFL